MRTLLTMLLFLSCLRVAPSPEEMYGMYDKDGKYRKMTEQVEQMRQRTAEAEKEEHNKKTLVLAVSILIGLIPVAVVGRNIVRKQAWKTNPKGAKEALVIAFAGGAALFAFNYGWFYLRILHEEIFKFVLFIGFLLLLIGIGVYVARKK